MSRLKFLSRPATAYETPRDEFVVWNRQRKNRHGRENLVVRVLGTTPAGYIIVERWRNGVRLVDAVHPRNLAAVES